MTFDLVYGAVALTTWILLGHYATGFSGWERVVLSVTSYFLAMGLFRYGKR